MGAHTPVLPRPERYANIPPVSRTYSTYFARALFGLGLALLLYAVFPAAAWAAPENFVHGRASLRALDGRLVLSLPLSVDNEDALGELLCDGASAQLSVKVSIQRKRGLWFNEGVYEAEFQSLLRHDPLSREYRLTMPGTEQIFKDKSLRALLARTWKDLRLPLAPVTLFTPDSEYIVKIGLSLKHTALPPWLDRTLVLWNKDVVRPAKLDLEYRTN